MERTFRSEIGRIIAISGAIASVAIMGSSGATEQAPSQVDLVEFEKAAIELGNNLRFDSQRAETTIESPFVEAMEELGDNLRFDS